MGKALDITFMTVRDTRGGSALYGSCEVCGDDARAIYVAELQRVYVRENGQHYLSAAGPGTYGEMPCLLKRFGTLRRDEDFVRVANTKLVSLVQLEELQRETET